MAKPVVLGGTSPTASTTFLTNHAPATRHLTVVLSEACQPLPDPTEPEAGANRGADP